MTSLKKLALIVYFSTNVVAAKSIEKNYAHKGSLQLKAHTFFIRLDVDSLSWIDFEDISYDVEFNKNITMITNW